MLWTALAIGGLAPLLRAAPATRPAFDIDPALARDWLARWERSMTSSARGRACDREMGEELGWLVTPLLEGFYYGYRVTGQAKWVDQLIDWADAIIRRAVKEPDGHLGWPKDDGASTSVVAALHTDNMLGEAMMLRPIVLMADAILKTPALRQHEAKARSYLELATKTFAKWDQCGCWRKTPAGGVWVVPPFGIDTRTGKWSDGYERRQTDGFSHPANKLNHIARWLLAMHDVTGDTVYRERAQLWFAEMKSRMRVRDGKFLVWNYWDIAGPWDRKSDGSPKHWVGVHPNGGYYSIDVEGIVAAHEHGMVFDRADIDRLIATNRDFMWDRNVAGAKFQRIDGKAPEARWKNSPGVLWAALLPYDTTLREVFEANHKPDSWGGLAMTPKYLSRLA